MEIQDVKRNLNKMIVYNGERGIYRLVGCIIRKNEKGFYYTVELLDVKHGRSLLVCKLKDIEEDANV